MREGRGAKRSLYRHAAGGGAVFEDREVVLAHGATDDLADARDENVHGLHRFTRLVQLHVERLRRAGRGTGKSAGGGSSWFKKKKKKEKKGGKHKK